MFTHVSEAEASRDMSAIMAKVREGDEVFIESEDGFIACLHPSDPSPAGADPEYDAWVIRKVQEALDDPRPAISHAEMTQRMEKHRQIRALEPRGSAR